MKRIFIFLSAFILFFNLSTSLFGDIPATERAALIALYNSTNGDGWTDNTGWKTAPLHTDGFAMPGTEGSWHGITVETDRVTSINQFNNNLNGTTPSSLENLTNLRELNLSYSANLSGNIPPSLSNLTTLEILNFDFDQLDGTIPTSIGNLINLTDLRLTANQLSETIPTSLGNLSKLEYLGLERNDLTGTIPPSLGNLTAIKYLKLNDNDLTGTIPTELGNLANLQFLYLSDNRLSGSIPASLGNLSNLWILDLTINDLTGTIPTELGDLTKLQYLKLKANRLSGTIPASLGNLTDLRNLSLGYNKLTGEIPVNLSNLNISASSLEIGYNGLYTDNSTLISFLNNKDPDWSDSQTIAPDGITATVVSNTAIYLSWQPIVYTGDTGGYRIFYSMTPGGPYTFFSQTANKSTTTISVTGLSGNTTYYFLLKTQTDAHDHGWPQDSTIISDPSDEVSAKTFIDSFTISGRITVNGNPLKNVVININNGFPGKPATDNNGDYIAPVPYNWSGTISPELNGYIFTPANRSYSGVTSSITDQSFTATTAPTLTTAAISNITTTTANSGGTISGSSITARGVCWNTSAFPTTAGSHTSNGAGSGSFISAITGLEPYTTYHVRAYATNSSGTVYGNELSFTTAGLTPTAITRNAVNIGYNFATLNGRINANRQNTNVTFEYGTTNSYGTSIYSIPNIVSGSTITSVERTLTDLTLNTTYHYRVVAQNSAGTTYGTNMTFTTGAAAPIAITQVASAVGTNQATLNGRVNANNQSTNISFEYGLTTAYGTTAASTPSTITGVTDRSVLLNLTGLSLNTTYHYRVIAQNGTGTTYGSGMIFTTGATVPIAITNAASGIGTTEAILNGSINANNQSTNVTFEYGTTTAYGTTIISIPNIVAGTTITPVSRTINGLTLNTSYHYRVVGQNGTGTTNGADMTFTTGAAAPIAITEVAGNVGTTSAILNGIINANNQNTNISFEYGTTTAYGNSITTSPSTASGTNNQPISYNLTGLALNTTYHYRISGQNTSGVSNGADMSFTTGGIIPSVTTLAASNISGSSALLNGTINANTQSTSVTFEYGPTTAYGKSAQAIPNIINGTTDTPVSYILTGLKPETIYHFRAIGQNGIGRATGSDMTFTTGEGSLEVYTEEVSDITSKSAMAYGNIVSTKTVNITSRGICWSRSDNPLVSGNHTENGSGVGSFSSILTGLSPKTTYYARAYAIDDKKFVYGNIVVFKTSGFITELAIITPENGAVVQGNEKIFIASSLDSDYIELHIDDVHLGYGTLSTDIDHFGLKLIQTEFSLKDIVYLYLTENNSLRGITGTGMVLNIFSEKIGVENFHIEPSGEIYIQLESARYFDGQQPFQSIIVDPLDKSISGLDKKDCYQPEIKYTDKLEDDIIGSLSRNHNFDHDIKNAFTIDEDEVISLGRYKNANYFSLHSSSKNLSEKRPTLIAYLQDRPVKITKILNMTSEQSSIPIDLFVPDETSFLKNAGIKTYILEWNTLDYPDGMHKIQASSQDKYGQKLVDSVDVVVRNFIIDLSVIRKEDAAYTFSVHFGEISFNIDNPKNLPVTKYVIYRKEMDGDYEPLTEIESLSIIEHKYTHIDNNITKENNYTYKIIATDSNGKALSESNEKSI